MILDQLERLSQYRSLHKHIDKVVTFCENTDLAALAEGRHDIEGDEVFAIAMTLPLRKLSEAKLETHRAYIDIQVVLKGNESMGYQALSSLNSSEGYAQDTDLEFWNDQCDNVLHVPEQSFALFFPADAHLPLIGEGEVQKIVFKLRA